MSARRERGAIWLYAVLALAILVTLAGIGRSIYNAGATSVRAEWEAANRKQRKAEAEAAAKAGLKKEKADAKARVVYRTITQQVDRYVDRPVYRADCFDADGVRDANAALVGAIAPAGKPDRPVRAPDPAR